ncbi:TPA: phytanoyl-CoA dioxygenase family protein [Pseudomonas aeruginosa]
MSTRRLTTVSCDTPIEQVVEIIRRDGAVAISNFVSEETLKSLTEDLDSYLGVTPCGMDPYFAGTQTRRTARILAKSDSAVEVALNPLFLETAKQVLQTPTHVWVGNDRVEITPDIGVWGAMEPKTNVSSESHRKGAFRSPAHPPGITL